MQKRYFDTKLLNVLFTRALASYIPDSSSLIVNTADPGLCDSGLRRSIDHGQFAEELKQAQTPEEASRHLVWATLGPNPEQLDEVEVVTEMKGAFIANAGVSRVSPWVRSEEGAGVQNRVWEETLEILTKVDARVAGVLKALQILDGAKKGNQNDITILSNAWTDIPGIISPTDACDVFLHHLDVSRVPTDVEKDRFADPANLAFASLLGLGKVGAFLNSPPGAQLGKRVLDAWPGIFKWTVFLMASRVEALEPENRSRRSTLDVVATCWYALAQQDLIREAMVRTPATIEIATKLWVEDDKGPVKSSVDAPVGTCALGTMLQAAKKAELDRVLKAKGGKAGEVAKLALERLKGAVKETQPNPAHLTMYLDFINSISRQPTHALRRALLSGNVIWHVTGALVKISVLVNTSRTPGFVDAMVSAFGYLRNCLESSDGFTWISMSIGAGLIPAICDCSPQFSQLEPQDFAMIKDLVSDILPRYLVYRSVVEAVHTSLCKVSKAQQDRVQKTRIRDAMHRFIDLAGERYMVVEHANATKGWRMTCDNIKCQKVKSKEEVRRCSACLTTFYCSKECQAIAWKEGDHKIMCKLKARERLEGKAEAVSRKDAGWFHVLFMRDARRYRYEFRSKIKAEYPSSPLYDFVLCMDYTVFPMKPSIRPLKGYNTGPVDATSNAEARNDALIEKVQNNPERFALIESKISCGRSMQCVLTLGTGEFWTSEAEMFDALDAEGSDEEPYDPSLGPEPDHIDMMRARMMLDQLVHKIEEGGLNL
ncbi:hypothetical protein EIP91_003682 [Steccherinum ochraceum]|uniref:MYND-type domain-containing protein n=1 Tax=Steccherinum ochraceum TaxID=92696 RepID=A0A4R0RCK0_9APHY|nr:hypothetical protein EIP91_003682 [Steccherinum ochraceum]